MPSASASTGGSVRANTRAPDFTLPALDGHPVHLADLHGKTVLLNFWATWCAPCRVETPWLVDLYRQYRSQGLEIVGVSMDDGDRAAVARFVGDYHVNYAVLLGSSVVADAYGGVRFLPQTVVIDRDGVVVKRTFGIQQKAQLEEEIRQALRPRGPA